MSTTFYTSDLHFGHSRIVDLSHRPFKDVDEMNHALIQNWNKTVTSADDIVWVLGDLAVEGAWKVGLEAAKQLKGRLRLVTGNHDRAWVGKSDAPRFLPEYHEVFEIVTPWARSKINGTKVLLSHFPYSGDHTDEDRFEECRLREGERPLLHGHTHSFQKITHTAKGTPQVHVGVDAWNFKPVSTSQVFDVLYPYG